MRVTLIETVLSAWQDLLLGKLAVVPPSVSLLGFCLALATLPSCSDVYAQTDETYAASLVGLSPSPVQEGGRLTIEVKITPTLPADYVGKIHGGVIVFDSYNDESEGLFADELIAVAFYAEQVTKPESTEGRPWGQPLKKPEGAPLNLG